VRWELFFRDVVDDRCAGLPFLAADVRPEVRPAVWRTRFTRSSGNSEARVFASSTTSFAWREKESLLRSANNAALRCTVLARLLSTFGERENPWRI